MNAQKLQAIAATLLEGTVLNNKDKISDKLDNIKFASLYANNADQKLQNDASVNATDDRVGVLNDEDDDFYGYWEDIESEVDTKELYALESTDVVGEIDITKQEPNLESVDIELEAEIDALFESIEPKTEVTDFEDPIDTLLESIDKEVEASGITDIPTDKVENFEEKLESELDSMLEQLDQESEKDMKENGFMENKTSEQEFFSFNESVDPQLEAEFEAELDALFENDEDTTVEAEANLESITSDDVATAEAEAMQALSEAFDNSETSELETLFEDIDFSDDAEETVVLNNEDTIVTEEPIEVAAAAAEDEAVQGVSNNCACAQEDADGNGISDESEAMLLADEDPKIDEEDINLVNEELHDTPLELDTQEEIINRSDDYDNDEGLTADAQEECDDNMESSEFDSNYFMLESDDEEDSDEDDSDVEDSDDDKDDSDDDDEDDEEDSDEDDSDDDDSDDDDKEDSDDDDKDEDDDEDDIEFSFDEKED